MSTANEHSLDDKTKELCEIISKKLAEFDLEMNNLLKPNGLELNLRAQVRSINTSGDEP
jgi:hypothetical protein